MFAYWVAKRGGLFPFKDMFLNPKTGNKILEGKGC